MISDPIDGAPPEGMKTVPTGALQQAAQMTNMSIFIPVKKNFNKVIVSNTITQIRSL